MAPVPIDRGWAWMCVLGAGICSFVVVGGLKSLGILLVEIVQRFGVSSATASLMMALVSMGVSIIAPLSAALGERFSYRFVIIVGGLLCSFANFATAFANNATCVVVIYGTFTGAGFGCIAGTSLVVVGMYFNRRRSLANGLAVAGGSAGQLLIPIFIRFLLDTYSFTGALIVFSGVCLHILPAALLMRPFSFYTNSGNDKRKKGEGKTRGAILSRATDVDETEMDELQTKPEDSHLTNSEMVNTTGYLPEIELSFIDDDLWFEPVGMNVSNNITDSNELKNQHKTGSVDGSPSEDDESDRFYDPAELKHYLNQYHKQTPSKSPRSKTREVNGLRSPETQPKGLCHISQTFPVTRQDSVSSRLSLRSLDIVPLQDLPAHIEAEDVDDLDETKPQLCNCPRDFLTTFCCCFTQITPKDQPLIRWSLFRNKLFVLYVAGMCLGNTGYMMSCLFLPAHAQDIGMAPNHAAMLLSIMGVVDLVGRIGGGWFADLGYISRSQFLSVSMLVSGTTTLICIPLFSSGGLVALAVVLGLFGGCTVSLQTVVLVDYLGASQLSASYGLSIMCQGFVTILVPSLLGVARDNFGSYAVSYFICAGLMLMSGTAFMMEPCVRRCQERCQPSHHVLSPEHSPSDRTP